MGGCSKGRDDGRPGKRKGQAEAGENQGQSRAVQTRAAST